MFSDLLLDSPVGSHRTWNFSAGPGALPQAVLEQARDAIQQLPGAPLSVLGISHRSVWFAEMVAEVEQNLRLLIGLPSNYQIGLLQGGASLQFSMIPMNFLAGQDRPAAYVDSGYWSHKAIVEAEKEGATEVVWSGRESGYTRLPADDELQPDRRFAYLHYSSNETVEGIQFHREPAAHADTPRICDMSSDFLSRPIDADRYRMIYAHAQKNLGPAGVCICLVHDELIERAPDGLPSMLDYRNHFRMHSAYNTPPVFAIYVVLLVTRWLRDEIGGLEAMDALNRKKAAAVYQVLDAEPDFYRVRPRSDRSLMNIAFRLPSAELEDRFRAEAEEVGIYGLEGHRSVGGLRISLYNPVSLEAVAVLASFMEHFRARHG